MSENDMYKQVVKMYEQTGSVKETVERLSISKVKVQRILITEGLWCSRSSLEIGELYAQGLSTEMIAEKLHMTVKNVQAYIPYTRGTYGEKKTEDSEWSAEYRKRMKLAAERMRNMTSKKKAAAPKVSVKEEEMMRSDKTYDTHSVYKLHLELVDWWEKQPITDTEMLKLGKAEKSFSRTVLVPTDMTLHSMHYMIQKLFGWQNSHLHNFSLPAELFEALTENNLGKWTDLVGTLFYFSSESDDFFCDDDYCSDMSVKTWFRKKYTNNRYKAVCDTYYDSRSKIDDLYEWGKAQREMKIGEDLLIEQDPNFLLERLTVSELFIKKGTEATSLDKWHIELLTKAFNAEARRAGILRFDKKESVRLKTALDALKESKDRYSKLTEILYNGKADVAKAYGKNADEVIYDHLEKIILSTMECQPIFASDPKVSPNTDTLFYYYDYGDAWCIKITCEEIYIEGESGRYTDTNNNDVSADLNTRLCEADKKKRPVCIETDGINVIDDVGGISGFESFLKTVNDASDPERKETLSWAKMLGWTGKLTKSENML